MLIVLKKGKNAEVLKYLRNTDAWNCIVFPFSIIQIIDLICSYDSLEATGDARRALYRGTI